MPLRCFPGASGCSRPAIEILVSTADYGVEDAADSRSNGVGTSLGFFFGSCGASAATSSGPSAGGAGSAPVTSAAAYLFISRCWSVWRSAVWVVEQAESKVRLSPNRQATILVFIGGRNLVSAYNYYNRTSQGKYFFCLVASKYKTTKAMPRSGLRMVWTRPRAKATTLKP